MAKKIWCTSTSDPLAVAIAKKYNLTRRQAADILSKARRENPALNDDLELSYIETEDAFKNALDTYIKKQVAVKDAFLRPAPSPKELESMREEIEAYVGRSVPQEQLEAIMANYDDAVKYARVSGLTKSVVAKVIKGFRNPKRLTFIGHFITQYAMSLMYDVQNNSALRKKEDIPTFNTRKEYYTSTDSSEYVKDTIYYALWDQADALEKAGKSPELVTELRNAAKNLDTLLYMYGTNIFRTEGVRVTPEGKFVSTDSENDDLDRNEGDAEDQENQDAGEAPNNTFSISDSNVSIASKIVPDIKTLLATFKEKTRNGKNKPDPFGYGLFTFVSPNIAMNKILMLTRGCTTVEDMMEVFKNNETSTPWLGQLIRAIDINSTASSDEVYEVPLSRKEQLRTLAFKSFRKQWTRMRQQFSMFDSEGNEILASRDANVNHYEQRIWNKLMTIFRNHSGADIFKNGKISLSFLTNSIKGNAFNKKLQEIRTLMRDEAQAYIDGRIDTEPSFSNTYEQLSILEDEMIKLLKGFGINVTKQTLSEALMNTKADATNSPDVPRSANGNPISSAVPVATKIRKIKILYSRVNDISKELREWIMWMERQRKAGKTVTDTLSTNPLLRNKANSDYPDIRNIRNAYDKLILFLTEFSTEGLEQSAHAAGKDYYSFNNPSSVQTIVEGLTADMSKVRDYIDEKYGKDRLWFLDSTSTANEPHFYSDWLEYIYYNNGSSLIDYAELPSVNGKSYDELSDREYSLAIQQEYFNNVGNRAGSEKDGTVAWYRMHIASDKPKFSLIRFKKYNKYSSEATKAGGYKNLIAEKAIPFFGQEIKRSASVLQHAVSGKGIKVKNYDPDAKDGRGDVYEKIRKGKRITVEDVVKDGKYIFKNTGVSFFLNPFIVNEIEDGTELGEYVVDRVFNYHLYSSDRPAVDINIMDQFREKFHEYMSEMHDDYVHYLENTGLYAKKSMAVYDPETHEKLGTAYHMKYIRGMLLQWNQDSQDIDEDLKAYTKQAEMFLEADLQLSKTDEDGKRNPEYFKWLPYYRERCMYEDMLEEFVYNNWLAKANMMEIFDVDPAFYGTTTNFQKRNAQVVSAGFVIDPSATLHGKRVSDGKLRSVTISTPKVTSKYLENLRTLLYKRADEITDPKIKEQFLDGIEDTMDALKDYDPTDGQGLTSLTGLRKKMVGLGQWTRSSVEAYDNQGYYYDENGKQQWVYTDEAIYQRMKRGQTRVEDYLHVFNQPQKPFVYAFTTMNREGRGEMTVPVQHKNSEVALIFLSAFQQNDNPESQVAAISKFMEETAAFSARGGVDTVNFDSAVKIGEASNAIDINGLTPKQTLEKLRNSVFEYETDEKGNKKIKGYKENIVTVYDEKEYKIQQEKHEAFKSNQQPTGSQLKILAINNIPDDMECTLPDGSKVTGKELKSRYFALLRKKMMSAETATGKRFGLFMPRRTRLNKLSYVLRDMASSDSRFTSEEAQALSIVERNGEAVFALPLDDTGHQAGIEAKIISTIRKTYYKEKTNGGITVQATSWGEADDLAIRFYSTNPYDISNRKGILATEDEFNKAKEEGRSDYAERTYEEYKNKYQGGYAYMECEVPMPDYVKDMLTKNGKIDKKFFNSDGTWNMDAIREVVPDSVFDAICYRVPTEAKYSMMLCRVVRFSKEGPGSVARYPKELTVFTGSDFDIDTDYVELRPVPGNKNEAIDNEIFDLQFAALRSQGALQETFKPGDFSDLQRLSYITTLIEAGLDRNMLFGLKTKQLKSMCEEVENLDLMNPSTDIILHNQNSDAGAMIGIAAVGVTSHAFLSLYNDSPELNNKVRIQIGGEGFTVINAKGESLEFSGAVPLDDMYDMDGKLIGTEISKYVGASADAAKDAALYRLNITHHTLPLLITMHRLGISSDVARLLMRHPVMRRASEIWNDNPNIGAKKVIDIIFDEITTGMSDNDFSRLVEDCKTNCTLSYDDLLDAISNPKEVNIESKAMICAVVQEIAGLSDSIRNIDSFYRYNSTNAMRGSSFLDRYAKRQQLVRLQDNINKENARILLPDNISPAEGYPNNNYGKLCAMFPYIAQAIYGEEELEDQLILDNMPTYSPVFFEAAKTLNIESKPEALKALYAGWKNYLFFVGPNRIADFRNEKVARFYTRDFYKYYNDTMEKLQKDPSVKHIIEDNLFLDNIGNEHAKEGFGDFLVLTTSITNMKAQELEKFKQDWELLLSHSKTAKLATDIAIHFMARSAAFSNNTPVHAIPYAVKQAIPNYFEAMDNANKFPMTSQDVYDFCVTYCLNNMENEDAVPEFFMSDTNTWISFDNGKLKVRATQNIEENYVIKTEDNKVIFRNPVMVITNLSSNEQMYVKLDNNVAEISEETTVEDGVAHTNMVYTFDATPVGPLGIPNQLAEYTKFGSVESIFLDPEQDAPDVESRRETQRNNEYEIPTRVGDALANSRIVRGSRVGTYVESSPYSTDSDSIYNYPLVKALARDRRDLINNPFLESRNHIGRVEKLADALGLKALGLQRIYDANDHPSYSFSVASSKIDSDQHTKARKLAALAGSLGNERSDITMVKTYVGEDENYNAIEFTIPDINTSEHTEYIEDIIDAFKSIAIDNININNETSELLVSINVDPNNAAATLSTLNKAIDIVTNFTHKAVEVNYVYEEFLDEMDRSEIIKQIYEDSRTESEPEKQDTRTLDFEKPKARNEVTLRDISKLALQRENGEEVEDDIRRLFGERVLPIQSPQASFASAKLVEDAQKEFEKFNIYDEIENLIEGKNYKVRTASSVVGDMIVNVANWIKGKRDEGIVEQSLTESGFTGDTAKTIYSSIKSIVEQQDLC